MPVVRDIHTNQQDVSCDVCGRTLLRGERAEPFLAGGTRRQVCDLCTMRAEHEGWIREEGADDLATGDTRHERRRRGLLERLRGRRPAPAGRDWEPEDELPGAVAASHLDELPEPAPEPVEPALEPAPAAPGPRADEDGATATAATARRRLPITSRRPRHVRAVPTNADLKMARALEVFNASEHTRTVGGVGRTLGAPGVCLRSLADRPSVVVITVMWELSWYRYEVDLSDEALGVRRAGQGDELSELAPEEHEANAGADERGRLHLTAVRSD